MANRTHMFHMCGNMKTIYTKTHIHTTRKAENLFKNNTPLFAFSIVLSGYPRVSVDFSFKRLLDSYYKLAENDGLKKKFPEAEMRKNCIYRRRHYKHWKVFKLKFISLPLSSTSDGTEFIVDSVLCIRFKHATEHFRRIRT